MDGTCRDLNTYHGSRKHFLHNSRQASYNHDREISSSRVIVDGGMIIPSEENSSPSQRNNSDDPNHLSKENMNRFNSEYEGYDDDDWNVSSGQRCRRYTRYVVFIYFEIIV
ncbi:unnamed protein product [Trichobilharzia regenti]|nr:unnamed protein product [Trichobilharzia regenti]